MRKNIARRSRRTILHQQILSHQNFKEQFGVTINNYLLNVRITHAKRELRFSGKSAEEIGAEVGFHELYYFSRVFKRWRAAVSVNTGGCGERDHTARFYRLLRQIFQCSK